MGAVAAFGRAALLLPGMAEAQALRGDAAYNSGELRLAADAYSRAVELDPDNAAYRWARSHRAGRQWTRTIAAYERVENAFPRLKREALLGTAWCHYLSGDDPQARFYTGLAARAGADVEPLRRALQRGEGAARAAAESIRGRRPDEP